jgi:hypothetical protein
MIMGMPVDQFSYIMLGVGAAAPAIFIITVIIAMQCYKRQKKKKLMRLHLRYQMAQNSMENGHMYPDQRRWTKDDVVLVNPILVSQKEISSTSNTAARSIGGSVVIMNGSIRNNPLPDFNPQQSASTPNVFFTDISIPILQLNGKPVRLNDSNEVCSIRSTTSSTRSNFELAPSSSTMNNWGFSPQQSLLGFKPYEHSEKVEAKSNPMLDELEDCDKENTFFERMPFVEDSSEMSNGSNSPSSDQPNEIKTTAIVIENPHFSNSSDEIASSAPTGNPNSPKQNQAGMTVSPKLDSEKPPSDLPQTSLPQKYSPSYVKRLEKQPSPSNKSWPKTKSQTPPCPDTKTTNNSTPKSQNRDRSPNLKNSNEVKNSDENDNEHNKARRKSWLFTSYVNKAYEPGPVETENEEILTSDPTLS